MFYSIQPAMALALIPQRSAFLLLQYGLSTSVLEKTQTRPFQHLKGLALGGKVISGRIVFWSSL